MKKGLLFLIFFILILTVLLSGCDEDDEKNITPRINSFFVTPIQIYSGQTAKLSWDVSNADLISIDNNIGKVNLSGEIDIQPTVNTVYTITATNSGGNTSTKTSIYVIQETENAGVGVWNENAKIKITLIKAGNSMPPEGYSIQNSLKIKVNGTELEKNHISISSWGI